MGCIIVCSADKEESLESTIKWKKIIDENSIQVGGERIPIFLAQNKADLITDKI